MLAEFPSAVGAALAAEKIRSRLRNSDIGLELRIGLHVGDVMVRDDDLFGDGINVAARLQGEAEPDGILASSTFVEQARRKAGLKFVAVGQRTLKNIPKPVDVFALGGDIQMAVPGRTWLKPALIVLAMVAFGVAAYGIWRHSDKTVAEGPPRIAVLRFESLSSDQEQAYFAAGMAEDLITDLTKVEGIRVLSPNSSFTIDPDLPTVEIAKRLGVSHVLSGSVRRSGDILRISARLVDVADDQPTWAERYDGQVTDVFGFQDRIRASVVTALRVNLTEAEITAINANDTENPKAFDAYLRGLRYIAARRRLDVDAVEAARKAFNHAIQIDPNYALAYAGLAWTEFIYYESINYYGGPDRAFELAEKSVHIAETALAHRTLSKRYFNLMFEVDDRRNPEKSTEHLTAARRLQPGDPDVLADLASTLPFDGRPKEAVELITQAMELNPAHPYWYYAASGVAFLLSGQAEQAVRDLGRWSDAQPNWHIPHLFLASAYGIAGQEAEARTALKRFTKLIGGTYSLYAVNRSWPMAEPEREIFNRGLQAAGMK
ncbi:MAG: adenylate/guanylate cyclase domain-containing protein [Ruegeria sp.]